MGWLAETFMGGVFAFGAWLSWDLIRANLRHGHHERPAPPPEAAHEPDFYGSMFVDEFTKGLAERYEMVDPAPWLAAPTVPPPSEAEVAASRAAHGYIPELDPGPEAAAPAPSPDQDPLGGESSTAGGSHSSHPATSTMGSRAALQAEPSNPAEGTALGPRAGAVLAAYEQRLGARREACT